MEQVFIKYTDWEDFRAGMWNNPKPKDRPDMLKIAIYFTGDHIKYGEAMMKVVFKWPNTMIHNLTDKSINRRAFIGHCAVCMEFGIPEQITREAWGYLTKDQRILADAEAEKAYLAWENKYMNK